VPAIGTNRVFDAAFPKDHAKTRLPAAGHFDAMFDH